MTKALILLAIFAFCLTPSVLSSESENRELAGINLGNIIGGIVGAIKNQTSTTTPATNTTTSTPATNNTSSTPATNNTSSNPPVYNNSTSNNNNTSSTPVTNNTSSTPSTNNTSSYPLVYNNNTSNNNNNNTSSTPVNNSTFSTPATNNTNATNATTPTNPITPPAYNNTNNQTNTTTPPATNNTQPIPDSDDSDAESSDSDLPSTNTTSPTNPTNTTTPAAPVKYAKNDVNMATFKDDCIRVHNDYRNQVGLGNLTWSDSLATSAQAWANDMAKNGFRHSGKTGENIASTSYSTSTLGRLLGMWVHEKAHFIVGCKYPKCSSTSAEVGHYTQIVWHSTTQVGCGFAPGVNRGYNYLCCQYYKAGNIVGQYVY